MNRPQDTSRSRMLPFSSDPELRRRFAISKDDIPANVRWGLLLEVLDDVAEETALACARRADPAARVVTAAIDDIILRTPASMAADLNLHARVNHVGRTSMEVGIRMDHGTPESLASCYFTMVARVEKDGETRSLPLPQLEYVDEWEKMRREGAMARKEAYRKQLAASNEPPNPEEYELLASLHRAQELPGFAGLRVSDLVRTGWERMYPEHENVPQKIFGGYLIRRAFELALLHAGQLATHRPVAVRVNRINFLQPVRIGDDLHFTSRITYTGRTSLAVEIGIERVSIDRGIRAISNTCVFTFVNVDERMRPQPVPPVYPSTYAEDARYLEGHRRRQAHRAALEVQGAVAV